MLAGPDHVAFGVIQRQFNAQADLRVDSGEKTFEVYHFTHQYSFNAQIRRHLSVIKRARRQPFIHFPGVHYRKVPAGKLAVNDLSQQRPGNFFFGDIMEG